MALGYTPLNIYKGDNDMAEKFVEMVDWDKIDFGELDGKKVKLNTERIHNRKYGLSERFSRFVNKNKDTVFTAKNSSVGTMRTGYLYWLVYPDGTESEWKLFAADLLVQVD